MRSEQRKSVKVIWMDAPTRSSRSPSGTGAQLAPNWTAMNIRVTVRAVLADISEDGPEVALRAVNFFVHSAKRISRGVRGEFWTARIGAQLVLV